MTTTKLPAKRSYQQFSRREVQYNGAELDDGDECNQFGFTNGFESQPVMNGVKNFNQ